MGLILLLVGLTLPLLSYEHKMKLWALTRTWPVPMPVHAESDALPTMFSRSCEMDTPCMRPGEDSPQIFRLTKVNLTGTFCFSLITRTPCIQLKHKNITAWMSPPQQSEASIAVLVGALNQISSGQASGSGTSSQRHDAISVTTLGIRSSLLVPVANANDDGTHFTASPHCVPDSSFPPIFTPCQSKSWEQKQLSPGFTLSPPLKRFIIGKSENSTIGDGWPWFQWLVSNRMGAVSDISAIAQLGGIDHKLQNISGTVRNDPQGGTRLSNIKVNEEMFSATSPKAEVCVQTPFMFLLTNTTSEGTVDCTIAECILAECWNGTWRIAVLMKIPTLVPIPVEADPETFPMVSLLRTRRDFGITATIVTAIALSAASAITAAVVMSHQMQTAEVINDVVHKTATVLETENRIDKHLLSGIVAANQRIDLVQAQVEDLFNLVQLGCVAQTKHVCITPLRFMSAGNQSQKLSEYLAGNWSREAEHLIQRQLLQITTLNDTRFEPISFGDFTDWLSSAFSLFKEWVGVGIFGVFCCFGIFSCLWFLCRLRAQHAQERKMIVQALAALEQGHSPQVWLAKLEKQPPEDSPSSPQSFPLSPLRFTLPPSPGPRWKFWEKF